MNLSKIAALSGLLTLAACTAQVGNVGPDGRPLPQIYRIDQSASAKIQYTVLDSINSLRLATGLEPVMLDANLTAAAATHARDMSAQARPWHFGSDGSSPIDRARRAGFSGRMLGETISETYESEVETIAAWMGDPDTRNVLMDPKARQIGISWYQETDGKIWWTVVMGRI